LADIEAPREPRQPRHLPEIRGPSSRTILRSTIPGWDSWGHHVKEDLAGEQIRADREISAAGIQQGDGGGQAYSRRIEPMGMAAIARYHDPDHLGIPLPPIDHQGINDQDNGKAWFASEASE